MMLHCFKVKIPFFWKYMKIVYDSYKTKRKKIGEEKS